MEKRLISLVMVFVMMLSILPITVPMTACAVNTNHNCEHENATSLSITKGTLTNGNYYLSEDVTLTGGITVASGSDVTICLNGHNIFASGTYIDGYMITTEGTLTITDCYSGGNCGSIINRQANGMLQAFGATGVLNIENGNIVHRRDGKDMVNAFNGGKVNISGGTFTNEATANKALSTIYGFLVSAGSGSEISVTGGTFTAKTINGFTPFLINTDGIGKLNISGGYFEAPHYGYSHISFSTTTITGGTFKTATSTDYAGGTVLDIGKKLSADYELVPVSTGYQVKKIEAFGIGAETYFNFEAALASASNGDTIKTLRDGKLNSYNITKKVTLDLNGHTLQGVAEDTQTINVVAGGKLTINDSSSSKTGKLYAYNTTPALLRVDGGELVVNGGNFTVQVENYISYSHVIDCKQGKVTLNDGTFSVLKGCDTSLNQWSSVVAATRATSTDISEIYIKGGTYNAATDGNFSSRIFTPYKGDNTDFGTIHITGGNFNGDYNNPELTETNSTKTYLYITGGSFDRSNFTDNVVLSTLIDTNHYCVVKNGTRYNVQRKVSNSIGASTGYTITSNLKTVTKVTVDGKVIDSKYYTISGGNVTLTEGYLKTLANGNHTVRLYDGNKVATATITIKNNVEVKSATTGDIGIALYCGMAVMSLLGAAVVVDTRKRKII